MPVVRRFPRLGGDEFAVLVAGVDAAGAAPTAARIRHAIADGAPYCTGLASAPADGTDIDALYRAADQALYAQKRLIHTDHPPWPARLPADGRASGPIGTLHEDE